MCQESWLIGQCHRLCVLAVLRLSELVGTNICQSRRAYKVLNVSCRLSVLKCGHNAGFNDHSEVVIDCVSCRSGVSVIIRHRDLTLNVVGVRPDQAQVSIRWDSEV